MSISNLLVENTLDLKCDSVITTGDIQNGVLRLTGVTGSSCIIQPYSYPSAGNWTDILFTGYYQANPVYMTISNTSTKINTSVDSSSVTTGALVVTGGVGVSGKVNLGGSLYLQTTGAIPSPMSYYETFPTILSVTGAFNGGLVVKFTRLDNVVTFTCNSLIGSVIAGSPMIIANGSIPPRFTPTSDQYRPCIVQNLAANTSGTILFGSNGSISIYVLIVNNFSTGSNGGMQAASFVYNLT